MEFATEALILAPLPMEVQADGDAPKVECVCGIGGDEVQCLVGVSAKGDSAVGGQCGALFTSVFAARFRAAVGAIEAK